MLNEKLTFTAYITVDLCIKFERTKRIKEKGSSLFQAIPRRDPYYMYFPFLRLTFCHYEKVGTAKSLLKR